MKNSTAKQWKSIAKKERKREAMGKPTEVLVKGKVIPNQKLRKEIVRYGVASEEDNSFGKKTDPGLRDEI